MTYDLRLTTNSMGKNRFLVLSGVILFLALTGCQKSRIYEKHQDIDNYSWHRIDGNHLIKFDVPVADSVNDYDINIAVRYMSGFPYTNLEVGFFMKTPDGEEKYSKNSLQLRGADGSYKGEGLGDLWDLNVPVIKKYRFKKAGTYKFEVENLMDKFDTPGVIQIGLIIEKTKKD